MPAARAIRRRLRPLAGDRKAGGSASVAIANVTHYRLPVPGARRTVTSRQPGTQGVIGALIDDPRPGGSTAGRKGVPAPTMPPNLQHAVARRADASAARGLRPMGSRGQCLRRPRPRSAENEDRPSAATMGKCSSCRMFRLTVVVVARIPSRTGRVGIAAVGGAHVPRVQKIYTEGVRALMDRQHSTPSDRVVRPQ